MNNTAWKWLWIAPLLTGALIAKGDDSGIYVVKEGDVLSRVSRRLIGHPIYKKDGALDRLLAMNPQIANRNFILPGDRIRYTTVAATPTHPERVIASLPTAPAPQTACPAAEPAREPASEEKATDVEFQTASRLDFGLGFEYFRINSTDRSTGASAALLSQMSPSLRAAWDLQWTPDWSSRIYFKYRSDKMTALDDNSKTMQNANGSSFGFGADVERHWSEGSYTHAGFRQQDELFVHSPNTSTIAFDRVALPSVNVGHEQRLLKVKRASAGVGAQGSYLFAGQGPSYAINSGFEGRGYVYIQHERETISLRGELFYEYQGQNSALTEQTRKNVGATVGIQWKLP